MEPRETEDLICLAQNGDCSALEQLTVGNIALVKSIVKRFLGRGVEYDDLVQIGSIGLIKAINNFDPAFSVRFSTYAVPLIIGEIKRFFRDDGMVKVSRTLKETAAQAATVKARYTAEHGVEPSIAQIAGLIGVPVEDVVQSLEAAVPCVSIDEPLYGAESEISLLDTLYGGSGGEEAMIDRVLIKEMLAALEPWERAVIFERYFEDKTQSEIAADMGISQVQVSRLEHRILNKLRGEVSQRRLP